MSLLTESALDIMWEEWEQNLKDEEYVKLVEIPLGFH